MRIFDILRTTDPSFPTATAFIADEIAAKIDGSEADDFTHWPPEAYGNIAPPYPAFVVEARTSTSEREIAEYSRLGNLSAYDDTKFCVDRALLFEDVTNHPRIKSGEYTVGGEWAPPASTCWVLAVYGFMRMRDEDVSLFPGHGYIHIGADGRLLDDTSALHLVEYPARSLIPGASYLPIAHLSTFVPFGLFAIKALHDRCEVEHYKPSRQVRRVMERKEGIEAQQYYILKLTTPSRQRRPEKPPELKTEKPGKRLHDVRGHFHFYTPEKPLFGRIAGAVWIPAHKRGKKDAGEIKKDYRLAPAEAKEEPTT